MDTHTAVAYKVYGDYKKSTGDSTKTVIASTANPYKFGAAVFEALGGINSGGNRDEFDIIEKLEAMTKTVIPEPLAATKNKAVRFSDVIEREKMPETVMNFLTE